MKTLIAVLALVFVSSAVYADQYVNPYTTRKGTYVPGHYKSDNDNTQYNNYSADGNVNPYTNQAGHDKPTQYPNPYARTPKQNYR